MRRTFLILVLVTTGCDGEETPDWSGTPLEPVTVTLEGVTFTISVPKGLPRDADEDPGTWNVTKVEGDHLPKVFTHFGTGMQKSVDDFASWVIVNKGNA